MIPPRGCVRIRALSLLHPQLVHQLVPPLPCTPLGRAPMQFSLVQHPTRSQSSEQAALEVQSRRMSWIGTGRLLCLRSKEPRIAEEYLDSRLRKPVTRKCLLWSHQRGDFARSRSLDCTRSGYSQYITRNTSKLTVVDSNRTKPLKTRKRPIYRPLPQVRADETSPRSSRAVHRSSVR
jgi:hypothetical protein